VKDAVNDVTPTLLTQRVLETLRSADNLASTVLRDSGKPY